MALCAVVALAACRRERAASPAPEAVRPAGGVMMNGVLVKRLGSVAPGETETAMVDPRPIVLWAGPNPAAVLTYRIEQDLEKGTVVQEIAPIRESVGENLRGSGKGLPVVYKTTLPSASEADQLDRPDLGGILAADVNGDGVDELVIARQTGGADLVSWSKLLATQPAPSSKPDVASYRLIESQLARIGGRAVVHLLYERAIHDREADASALSRAGAGDAYELLRVDANGISRVRLTGKDFNPTQVLAVGVINGPGSSGLDELVALSRKDEGEDVYASRHRVDGALLEAPKKVYVPLSHLLRWSVGFVPQSRAAIVTNLDGEPQVFFLQAEKATNWIREVDLKALAGIEKVDAYLGATAASSGVQAVIRAENDVYAVDADGTFFASGLVPAPKPQPLYTIKPASPLHAIEVVGSAERGDELLVVQSVAAGTKALTREQIAEAANKFLAPERLEKERRWTETSLEGKDPVRDRLIAEERKRRGVKQELKTVEEWRKLLPDSYAATVRDNEATYYAHLEAQLLLPLELPAVLTAERNRNLDEYRAWLAGMRAPAEATFELVRAGASQGSFRVGGELGPLHPSDLLRDAVEWRARGKEVTAVTTLSVASQGGAPQPGLYELRASVGGN